MKKQLVLVNLLLLGFIILAKAQYLDKTIRAKQGITDILRIMPYTDTTFLVMATGKRSHYLRSEVLGFYELDSQGNMINVLDDSEGIIGGAPIIPTKVMLDTKKNIYICSDASGCDVIYPPITIALNFVDTTLWYNAYHSWADRHQTAYAFDLNKEENIIIAYDKQLVERDASTGIIIDTLLPFEVPYFDDIAIHNDSIWLVSIQGREYDSVGALQLFNRDGDTLANKPFKFDYYYSDNNNYRDFVWIVPEYRRMLLFNKTTSYLSLLNEKLDTIKEVSLQEHLREVNMVKHLEDDFWVMGTQLTTENKLQYYLLHYNWLLDLQATYSIDFYPSKTNLVRDFYLPSDTIVRLIYNAHYNGVIQDYPLNETVKHHQNDVDLLSFTMDVNYPYRLIEGDPKSTHSGEFKNILLEVQNLGEDTLYQVDVNINFRLIVYHFCAGSIWQNYKTIDNLAIPPNGIDTIRFPDFEVWAVKLPFTPCFFLSRPNALKDINLSNNTYCGEKFVSVPDVEAIESIDCYPNPVTHQLYINLPTATAYKLTLTDLQGRIIQQNEAVGGGLTSLEMGDMPSGVYLLYIVDDNGKGSVVRKIVR